MATKINKLKIQLNKEGIQKLKKENKSMLLSENLMKEMIKDAILSNSTNININLQMGHKSIGDWKIQILLVKVK